MTGTIFAFLFLLKIVLDLTTVKDCCRRSKNGSCVCCTRRTTSQDPGPALVGAPLPAPSPRDMGGASSVEVDTYDPLPSLAQMRQPSFSGSDATKIAPRTASRGAVTEETPVPA